jgi:small subunit ribosomal protein S4
LSRYIESACKLCRREGIKLFLKGSRCFGEKCAVERRNYPPGSHGQNKTKLTEYGVQLREKQKLKRIYGVTERQFQRIFNDATRHTGKTGDALLSFLERRLDNVVYTLGFASSRAGARQLVNHGFVLVNGRKVDIPSFLVKVGNVIELKGKIKDNVHVQSAIAAREKSGVPKWLDFDPANMKATVKALPEKTDISLPVQEQLIVELYSK